MKVTFVQKTNASSGALIVGVEAGRKLTPAAQALDAQTDGALSRAMKNDRFSGKKNQMLHIVAPANMTVSRIILLGLGDAPLGELDCQDMGGAVYAALNGAGEKEAAWHVDAGGENLPQIAADIAYGARLRSYRFDKYRTQEKPEQKPSLTKMAVVVDGATAARKDFKSLDSVAQGVFMTRELVSEPPNILYPASFAAEVKNLEKLGVKVEILNEKKMEKLGMGALLGVGQGSMRESQMVIMTWNGGRNKRPLAFVGKGVTFDTGGISLKPGPGMEEMKWDMGGAGVVVGLMRALAERKAKSNVIGVIGLVENMPDGNAQRPGDIVTSMSGQTIEIHNTDAEGRLVLADALWYTQDRFKPSFMVDLATLTGAMMVSLGTEYAGFFSNDDGLSEKLAAAGTASGEKVWRMPLAQAYDDLLKTDGADMKNIGGRFAGAITAAQFLQRFVNKTPWIHLDIAGVTWSSKDKPTVPKGGTGFGVRLLNRFVADNFEG